jgi:hypothetical protein
VPLSEPALAILTARHTSPRSRDHTSPPIDGKAGHPWGLGREEGRP